jgi:hypothetical protein
MYVCVFLKDKVAKTTTLAAEHDVALRRLIDLEEQVKAKERKILEREDEILDIERTVLAKVSLILEDELGSAENQQIDSL